MLDSARCRPAGCERRDDPSPRAGRSQAMYLGEQLRTVPETTWRAGVEKSTRGSVQLRI